MTIAVRIVVIASIAACFLLQAQAADNYTDGNRPYEFGFTIDGEQHRKEKKDEKGLIQGEFGFITADGVYHVTVYATDEEGRFKILSMKNIRVKPYPTAKQSTTRQGRVSLPLDTAAQAPSQGALPTTTFKPISIGPPRGSCSSCSIPTTSTAPPAAPAFNPPISNSPNQIGTVGSPTFSKEVKPQPAFINQPSGSFPPQANANYPTQPQNTFNRPQTPLEQTLVPPSQGAQNFPPQGPSQNSPNGIGIPQRPEFSNPLQPTGSLNTAQLPGFNNPPQSSADSSFPEQQTGANKNTADPGGLQSGPASGRTPKRLDGQPPFGPVVQQPNSLQRGPSNIQAPAPAAKPTLISAQMQIVDKNTDIYSRGPGEKEGLPEGLTKDDMGRLLYTFNYTVGFHGHFEEGYTNGVKQGYYFITGRNGVKTRVDYVADSTGFHPKISQEVLDLLSDDVPKPETEKEDKYGLKGYEFKWLYYPAEAKGR